MLMQAFKADAAESRNTGILDAQRKGTGWEYDGLHTDCACVCIAVTSWSVGNINIYRHEIGNVVQIYSATRNMQHLHAKPVP
jgi:hypothetical protein